MRKEVEVNYKLQRINKVTYDVAYLVTDGKDYTWEEDYDISDLFDTVELLYHIVGQANVEFNEDEYTYIIIEEAITSCISFEKSKI
jgi:hypothetical protein